MRLNVQAVVLSALADAFPDILVRGTVPKDRPNPFICARREGGARRSDGHTDSAGIGVDCWAATEAEAAAIASRMSDVMMSLEYAPGIASVTEEAFRSDPDPADASPRWYGSYTLITYRI